MRYHYGFSLIELLFSMTILLILLGLITLGIVNGGGTVAKMHSQASLLDESRFISQLMADSISRAVYIYRPGLTLTLQSDKAYSVAHPTKGGNTWKVGDDPIIAFVEAAEEANSSSSCSASQDKACLHFVAFYPVLRSEVVANATGSDNPGNDLKNADKWILYEYRLRLSTAVLDTSIPPPLVLVGGETNILTDYVEPNSVSINYFSCRDKDLNLEPCTTKLSSSHFLATVQNGEYKFTSQILQKKKISVPASSFAIAPKNLYQE